ncbi:histidine kinase N-terminal 7TM domain-containing diguanylate cyclase [Salinispira pacifica]|uniref:diguanylate cyclase n=1 Tax=Salinispira pacifica TaxID=1307761 RepID=V5WKH9_9SPIO|nr:diguanylate cyclase [Salinispira pacifica]AHC15701.1 hypothetical protein L21SP2_2348 [Salinispira pacifica]
MLIQHDLVRISSLLAGFVTFAMLIWTGRRMRQNFRARIYFALTACTFMYAFGYSQALIQTNLDSLIFWTRFEFAGVPFIPLFLVLLSAHTRFYRENQPFPSWVYLFLIPGLASMFANWFYPSTNLYYLNRSFRMSDPFLMVNSITPGPLWYLQNIQAVAAIIFSLIVYAEGSLRIRNKRKDMLLMLFGISIPAGGFILSLSGIYQSSYDMVPALLGLASPFFAAGIISDRLISDLSYARLNFYKTTENPVFIFNTENHLIDLNAAALKAFRTTRKQALNRTWYDLLDGLNDGEVKITTEQTQLGKELSFNGNTYSYTSLIFKDHKGRVRGLLRALYDITQAKNAMSVLEQEASFDGLTGLLTRRRWENNVEMALKQGVRFSHSGSLLVLDLDHFKSINDTYGHQAGDLVLRELSQRLKSVLRDIDIIGRYGGEELGIWLMQTRPEDALVVGEKLRKLVTDLIIRTGGNSIEASASVGIYGENELSSTDLFYYFKKADRALYRAKENGRDRVEISRE